MELGHLAAIHRYPVKSLKGESLESAWVNAHGIEGDRNRALVVQSGHARVGKVYRGKENNQLHLTASLDAAVEFAKARDVVTGIEENAEGIMDDAPISLLIDRWLDGLSEYVGYSVEYMRFRPNFFVHATGGFALREDDLTGREIQLGEVIMRVRYPISRCVTTTYDLATGESDHRILRYVTQARSEWMGIYCDVLRAGTVRAGDALELFAR